MLPAHPQRPLVFNVPSGSRGLDELVDLPPGLEPVDVAGKGPFMHFAKELDGFRFVARFAWIFGRDNLLDINRHDQPICRLGLCGRDIDVCCVPEAFQKLLAVFPCQAEGPNVRCAESSDDGR